MDWLMDDDMMKQWAEVNKEEEKIMVKRNEGRDLLVDRVQSVPELVVAQAHMKKKGGRRGEEASRQEFVDTDEMTQWRRTSQEGIKCCVEGRLVWKNCGRSPGEVQS